MISSLEAKDATLIATAFTGLAMATSHYLPLALIMLPLLALTMWVRHIAGHPAIWAIAATAWAVASVVRRQDMEDHVYAYLAWLVAVAVALVDPRQFEELVAQQGRRIIAAVFGFATFWKVASGEFVTGAALWTLGLYDSRLTPLMRLVGISGRDHDAARPEVLQVATGELASFDIELSSYSNLALVAVSLGTLVLEATIALSHAVADSRALARLRIPALLIFGLVTYSVVPVLTFALILAVMGAAAARFDRRAVTAMFAMVVIAILRFATL